MLPTPSTPKTFTLGGQYELQTGTKYLDQCIKDIKSELEAHHGVPIEKISNDYVLLLTCCNAKLNIKQREEKYFEKCSTQKKNTSKSKYLEKANQTSRQNCREQSCPRSKCTYFVKFSVLKNTMRPTQKTVYQLLDFNLVHDSDCYGEQNAVFYNIVSLLNSIAPAIEKVVCRKISKKQQLNSPKAIYEILCSQLGLRSDFLQRGLPEGSCDKRKIKKKFDNMIAEAKRMIVDPIKYIGKQQYARLYPEAPITHNHRKVFKKLKLKQQKQSKELQQQPQQSQSSSPPQKKEEQYDPRIDARRRRNFIHKSPFKSVQEQNIKNKNHSQLRSSQFDDQFQSGSKQRKKRSVESQFQDKRQTLKYASVEEKNTRSKFEDKQLKNVCHNLTPYKKQDQALNGSQIKESQIDFVEIFSENPLKIEHSPNKEKMSQFEQMEIEQSDGSSDYSIQYCYDEQKKAKVVRKQKRNKRQKKSPSSKTSGKVNIAGLEQNSDKLSKTKPITKIRNTKASNKRCQVQQKSNNAQTTAKKTEEQEQKE